MDTTNSTRGRLSHPFLSLQPFSLNMDQSSNPGEIAEKFHALTIPPRLQPLMKGLKDLQWSETYPDLTITCNDQSWKVHKLVLCTQSKFFHMACTGGFREATRSEIKLDEDDPQIVEHLMFYFYNFDYDVVREGWQTEEMLPDVGMYAIADKYLIEPLQILAAKKFCERSKSEYHTSQFISATAEIYESTSSGNDALRKTVVDIVMQHRELLDRAKGNSDFLRMVSETPELGADLAVAFASPSHLIEQKYRCPMCAGIFGSDWKCAWGLKLTRGMRCPWCQSQGPMGEGEWKPHLI